MLGQGKGLGNEALNGGVDAGRFFQGKKSSFSISGLRYPFLGLRSSFRRQGVQGQIEPEDIDPGFSQEAKSRPFGVFRNEGPHFIFP